MGYGQTLEHGGQLLFRVAGQHLIDGREVALLGRPAGILIHIEDERLQEIGFAVVPEVVAFVVALGVGDDDVGEDLGHERVAVQVEHGVP